MVGQETREAEKKESQKLTTMNELPILSHTNSSMDTPCTRICHLDNFTIQPEKRYLVTSHSLTGRTWLCFLIK